MFGIFKKQNIEELPNLRPEIKKIYDYVKFNINLFELKVEKNKFSIVPQTRFLQKKLVKYISVFNNSLNVEEVGKIYAISDLENTLFFNLAKENYDRRVAGEYVKRYEELKRFSEKLSLK
jgi:hypothetical protein